MYIATVNDFVRAFIQVVKYYQYLKGKRAGTNLGKEKLFLYVAQSTTKQTGDPKVLNVAMAKLFGAEFFYIHEAYLGGKEVFGSQKRKADVLLGFESKSHQSDKVNFSRPRIATRFNRANHINCNLSIVVEDLSPKL